MAKDIKSESREKVGWSNIIILRFEKNSPNVIKYKTMYSSKEYNFINTTKGMRGRKLLVSQCLKKGYDKPPKISLAKLRGLLYLCNFNLIPLDSQNFYRQLEPTTTTAASTEDEDVD